MDEKHFEIQLQSSVWLIEEASKLIKQWKACKTNHARNKLIPKMKYMQSRSAFEGRVIEKLIELVDNKGENWKNE